jgi:predicted ferric reductase
MRRIAGWGLGLLAVANGVAILVLWLRAGGVTGVHGTAGALVSAGRITGLLGAYLALVMILLLGRIPVLDRWVGLDRLAIWHRRLGRLCLTLLVAHAVLITAGYAVADRVSVADEVRTLLRSYPGLVTATAGLAILVGVVVTSVVVARRRMRYETWYFVHLYAYLGVALAFSHQIATGREFVGDRTARAYWTGLYVVTLGALVWFRVLHPVARSLRHGLRVARVIEEGPGVVSLEIEGKDLERLGARAGQFFGWRFLTRDRWWEVHPFSLSAAPDGRCLRITVKDRGDFSRRLAALAPGTRVVAEGPYGGFAAARRRNPRLAMIAGGVGITPIRALLESTPGEPGDIAVVYRARDEDEVILRDELDALGRARGAEIHYLLGDRHHPDTAELLSAAHLTRLVPDIADRDVFVCGPPAMTEAARAGLRGAGVDRRQIVVERFEL